MSEAAAELLVVVRGFEVLVEEANGEVRLCSRESALRFGVGRILVARNGSQICYAASARALCRAARGDRAPGGTSARVCGVRTESSLLRALRHAHDSGPIGDHIT